MRWADDRDQELLDGLMSLVAVAVRTPSQRRVPAAVVELLEQLHDGVMSEPGHADGAGLRLDDVDGVWVPAREAGQSVGLSGRQVRRLCLAGLVRHHRTRAGYDVDVTDLRRHLSERQA